jgi:hypothetical protein
MDIRRVLITIFLFFIAVFQANAQSPGYYGEPGYGGSYPPYYGDSGYRRPPPMPYGRRGSGLGSLRMERGMVGDSYTLTIYLDGRSPKSVQVKPVRDRLVISSDSLEMQREQDQRGGYSYSRQWGSSTRTLRLPRDADAKALVRTDGEDAIDIRIPRISYRR